MLCKDASCFLDAAETEIRYRMNDSHFVEWSMVGVSVASGAKNHLHRFCSGVREIGTAGED